MVLGGGAMREDSPGPGGADRGKPLAAAGQDRMPDCVNAPVDWV